MADSNTRTHVAKAEPGSPEYKAKVAEPVMNAVDAMPLVYKRLVYEWGYVPVYRAWRRGMSPEMINGLGKQGRLD